MAILLVGAIFVGAVVALPTISFGNIQAVDYQQLRNTALTVFNTILLDSGQPQNWGSISDWSADSVTSFGLASDNESVFFTLDPDKVQRLVTTNPLGSINNTEVKRLLNLEDYGFNLRIIPPFNVTNIDGSAINEDNSPINETALTQNELSYSVKVSYLDGRPIPNANITSVAVYSSEKNFAITSSIYSTTNSIGICKDQYSLDFEPVHITVILKISVSDVATIVVTFGKNPVKIIDINMVSNNVTLTRPKDSPNAAVEVLGVYSYGTQELDFIYEGQGPSAGDKFNTGSGENSLWTKLFPGLQDLEPTLLIFNVETTYDSDPEHKGHQEVVIAGPYQNLLGYSIFEYGDELKTNSGSVTLQRSVTISGMTYTAEFTFWRE